MVDLPLSLKLKITRNLLMPNDNIEPETDLAIALNLYQIHANLIAMNEIKRQQANQIYMAIVSALIAAGAVVASDEQASNNIALDFCALLVLLISVVWYLSIQYHRRLASAKFSVIQDMERLFPMRPFHAEWQKFQDRETRPRSWELTKIERTVPIIIGLSSIGFLILRNLPI